MNISREELMAYADGELDQESRARIEQELATNPELASQLEQHRALRARLRTEFDPILHEPIPERLQSLVGTSSVSDLAQAREKKIARRRFSMPANWIAIAASLVLGVFIGILASQGDRAVIVASADGLTAKGALATALTHELASRPSEHATVRIGLSYASKSGEYCRTFLMTEAQPLAGLACRAGDSWRVRMLTPAQAASDTNFRTAASAMPTVVLDEVNREIQGEPFDADKEAEIAARGWNSR